MNGVILAAGKGLRMRPLTDEIPKAMIEVKGKSLLERSMENLKKAGIRKIGIVVGYKKEKIMNRFGNFFKGTKIEYFVQEKPIGTANAVYKAKDFVNGKDFIQVNGDVYFEHHIIDDLKKVRGFDAVLVGRKVHDPWNFGVLKVEANMVKGVIEKPEKGETTSRLVNAGIYKFSSKIFEAIEKTPLSSRKEYEITDSIKLLIGKGRVSWIPLSAGYSDVSDLKQLKEAEKIIVD
ncbi:MAG: sugar phosphate nucleotidyltransferase [archaeon]